MFHVDKGVLEMKVFAVDMDGTFLNSDNRYNKERFNALLMEYGDSFKLIVASSNSLQYLQTFFDHQDIYYAAFNGAIVAHNNKIIKTHDIELSDVNKMTSLLLSKDITTFVISTTTASFVLNAAGEHFITRMQRYYHDLKVIEEIEEVNVCNEKVIKITIELRENETLKQYLLNELNQLDDQCIAVDSGFNIIDIVHRDVNKARAINVILDQLNVSTNDLYTFGDSDNDIEMLKMTKNAYAMANANEKVKQIAMFETVSNDQDGVLKIMDEVLKKER